jgi:hypothetical protein
MRRLGALVSLGAALLVSFSTAVAGESGRSIEYLYIEANEGGSSGGHVALGLGDEVFHFEHRSPGILILGRDDREHFRHRYRVRENRTIHVSRIPVSETHRLLVERFRRRHFLQARHLDVIDGLRGDQATLEQMLSGRIDVEAAGPFSSKAASAASLTPDPDLAHLRARVEAAYGTDFLDSRAAHLRGKLAELDARAMELPEPSVGDFPPVPSYSYPQRYRDLITALTAVEILKEARPLAHGALLEGDADGLAFTEADATAARLLSEALSWALVRLAASERPDGGVALLVGMARLVALADSQRHGRWVVVDVFSTDAATLPRRGTRRDEMESELFRDARDALTRRGNRLVERAEDGIFPEADFAAFEVAVNRLGELRLAAAEGRERRALPGGLVSWRPASLAVDGLERAALTRGLDAVREREEAYAAGFKRRWGYHLLTRNCVSEIFAEIDAAFEGGSEEARARLGGRVDMDGSLNFIPALSAVSVEAAYPVTERLELPSYRRWRKGQMYEQENPVTVFLRESNTLTSAIYRRGADDSIFLFFTDDAVVARPLFGAVNLVVGLAASAVGLVVLPVDGGSTLWAGLKGAVFSLPELLFQNIRKGSFGHVKGVTLGEGRVSRQRELPGGG